MNTKRTDPPYFPQSAKTESPPQWEVGPPRNETGHRDHQREDGTSVGLGGTEKDGENEVYTVLDTI